MKTEANQRRNERKKSPTRRAQTDFVELGQLRAKRYRSAKDMAQYQAFLAYKKERQQS